LLFDLILETPSFISQEVMTNCGNLLYILGDELLKKFLPKTIAVRFQFVSQRYFCPIEQSCQLPGTAQLPRQMPTGFCASARDNIGDSIYGAVMYWHQIHCRGAGDPMTRIVRPVNK
jgi:hypothetical protein